MGLAVQGAFLGRVDPGIREVSFQLTGELDGNQGEKPFVHVLFFSQGGKKEEDTEG